jgi:hypothetical protein
VAKGQGLEGAGGRAQQQRPGLHLAHQQGVLVLRPHLAIGRFDGGLDRGGGPDSAGGIGDDSASPNIEF